MSGNYQRVTKSGYDFYEVASLLQKSLRRGDVVYGARAANELFPMFTNYVWNRLMTVSAEDCADMVTQEIVALYDGWEKVNQNKKPKDKGRVFIAKAIVLLAKSRHSRDADVLNILVSDRFPEEELRAALAEAEPIIGVDKTEMTIPTYVYDVHTRRGRKMGMTKQKFLRDEEDCLTDSESMFGNLNDMIETPRYLAPQPLF